MNTKDLTEADIRTKFITPVDEWESHLAAARTTADHLLSALVAELTAQN